MSIPTPTKRIRRTTLKGERPPPARQVAATPSGRTRAGGRALRSGIKGAPPAEVRVITLVDGAASKSSGKAAVFGLIVPANALLEENRYLTRKQYVVVSLDYDFCTSCTIPR